MICTRFEVYVCSYVELSAMRLDQFFFDDNQRQDFNTTLTNLNLYDNHISDAGATSIAKAIKVNKTLTNLNLDFRYMKIHIFALRWRDEIKRSSQLRTLLKRVVVNRT